MTAALKLTLPGQWLRLDPSAREESRAAIKCFVAGVAGAEDRHARARALMSERLRDAVDAAQQRGIQMLFVCREIAEGVPLPVTIMVHAPRELCMTPAVGTAPEAVAEALKRSLGVAAVAGAGGCADLAIEGSRIVRVVRSTFVDLSELDVLEPAASPREQRTATAPALAVDYWYTRPQSKELVLVHFSTPMTDAPSVVLRLFDAIATAARCVEPVAA